MRVSNVGELPIDVTGSTPGQPVQGGSCAEMAKRMKLRRSDQRKQQASSDAALSSEEEIEAEDVRTTSTVFNTVRHQLSEDTPGSTTQRRLNENADERDLAIGVLRRN